MAYKAISDYGVIGDRRTAALVGRDGSVDWLCLPDFDGPSVFGALLDDVEGGRFRLGPSAQRKGEQTYVGDTNLLRTRWDGLAVTDCMVGPGPRPHAEEGQRVMVRRLEARGAAVECELECTAVFDYGRAAARGEQVEGGALLRGDGPTLTLALPEFAGSLRISERSVRGRLRLEPGQVRWVVLATAERAGAPHAWTARRAEAAFAATERYWRDWTRKVTYRGPHRQAMTRCALLVHLLTYAPQGSVVAAPTTSLPEAPGGSKNFDYRYAWVRDASLAIAVLSLLGPVDEAQA